MRLKREQKLFLRADESSPWLPLQAGIFRRESSKKGRKRRWFPVGREAAPQEEITESVKVITLLLRFCAEDEAQELLLNSGGKPLLLKEESSAENSEITGFSAHCVVDCVEEAEGPADEPLTYRISLCISQEIPLAVKA